MASLRKPRPGVEFLAARLPPALFLRLYGLAKTGAWPDLRRPLRFSERQLARMLRPDVAALARTGDKYTMRAFVVERLGEGFLPLLHDVLEGDDRVTAARVRGWPASGVLKASHGSNWMRFVERSVVDPEELDAVVRGWLSRSYAGVRQERHYAAMTPRVLLEEDLRRDGAPPRDLKFYVFDGVPRLVMVDVGRFGDHRRFVADPEWRALDVACGFARPDADPVAPRHLQALREVAARLGHGLPFVRVDLYEVDDRVLVGEMTHFPDACVQRFTPGSFDAELGAVWGAGRPVAERWHRRASAAPAAAAGRRSDGGPPGPQERSEP